eukprot:6491358-Amphidinium_carterae.3
MHTCTAECCGRQCVTRHGRQGESGRNRLDTSQQGVLVTDGKSLYDHLNSSAANPSEKQVMLDLIFVREEVERGLVSVQWVLGSHQVADCLTKWMKPTAVICELHQTGMYSLTQGAVEAEEEARKALLRKGQRQRHRAKLKLELKQGSMTQ